VAAESVIGSGGTVDPTSACRAWRSLAAWRRPRLPRARGRARRDPVVLGTAAAKAALGGRCPRVEMESGALRPPPARGVPFAALRAVLDRRRSAAASADVIDEATGEVRAARALAAIALRRVSGRGGLLARQQRVAARRLAAIMGALEMAAIAARPSGDRAGG